MKNIIKNIACLIFLLSIALGSPAQEKKSSDSLVATLGKLKPYTQVVTANAITKKGLWTIHDINGKIYFELPVKLLGKELLMVTRISKGAINTSSYAGDEISNIVVSFHKGPGQKLFLRKRSYTTFSGDSTSTMYRAVTRSGVMPILNVFNVEAIAPDSSLVFSASDLILGDNEGFSLGAKEKADNNIGNISADKTFIGSLWCFPKNIEISVEKTFNGKASGREDDTRQFSGTLSLELNTSIVLLPEKPMRERLEDSRVGYFSLQQTDFDTNPNGVNARKYVRRWRLEPRAEDVKKYLSGQLVEPEKPIVFYIDPATPEKWVNYLIQGVNDWQKAFEQAGFKNAIVAKRAPTPQQDPTWSLYDARHSAIVYKPSKIENASGPSITDPRTGEILESHINWYHNVMSLLQEWYMVQVGVNDPDARKMEFNDKLMGQLIRFVSSHEVGHTLGLLHNFGSSATVPVAKLRDKKWVEENGFCPSIMDYARFNYVAQPEDHISKAGLMPRIGPYDLWAIEWGYRWLPAFASPKDERDYLVKVVTEKLRDKQYWYSSGEGGDPRAKSEDLGDDAVKASEYGIANLKRTIPNLINWTSNQYDGYYNLNRIYNGVQDQLNRYFGHVIREIGGVQINLRATGTDAVYEPVDPEKQKKVLAFLNENLFTTPRWLVDTAVLKRTGQNALGVIGELTDATFKNLFFGLKLESMVARTKSTFGRDTYNLVAYLDDLKGYVWTELSTHQPIDEFRRITQTMYLKSLIGFVAKTGMNTVVSTPVPYAGLPPFYGQGALAVVYGHLKDLDSEIKKQLPMIKDQETIYHLRYISAKINETFEYIQSTRYW